MCYYIRVIFIFISFIGTFSLVTAQTYVTPYLGVAINKIENQNVDYLHFPEFTNSNEYSGFIGVSIAQNLTNRIGLIIDVQYERLEIEAGRGEFTRTESGPIFNYFGNGSLKSFIHQRFSGSLGLRIKIWNSLGIDYRHKLANTSSIIWHEREFFEDAFFVVQLLEASHQISIVYLLDNVYLEAFYSHGYKGDTAAYASVEPLRSFGLKLGYQFKILDKLKGSRRKKVDCPKL